MPGTSTAPSRDPPCWTRTLDVDADDGADARTYEAARTRRYTKRPANARWNFRAAREHSTTAARSRTARASEPPSLPVTRRTSPQYGGRGGWRPGPRGSGVAGRSSSPLSRQSLSVSPSPSRRCPRRTRAIRIRIRAIHVVSPARRVRRRFVAVHRRYRPPETERNGTSLARMRCFPPSGLERPGHSLGRERAMRGAYPQG